MSENKGICNEIKQTNGYYSMMKFTEIYLCLL